MAGGVIDYLSPAGEPVAVSAANPLPVNAAVTVTAGPIAYTPAGGGVAIPVTPVLPLPIVNTGVGDPLSTWTISRTLSGLYVINASLGGLETITGLTPGRNYLLMGHAMLQSNTGAAGGSPTVNPIMFNALPTTTFTDGVAPTWVPADVSKVVMNSSGSIAGSGIVGLQITRTSYSLAPFPLTADGSGQVYVALLGNIAYTWPTPSTLLVKLFYREAPH